MNPVPLPVEQWDESLQGIVSDMRGKPINVHKLMAHHPDLLKAWWNFRNHVVSGGSLGPRLGELVILRVAVHMRAWYEWASHVDRAIACGFELEEIEQVKQGANAAGWTEQEQLILQAVDELTENHCIRPETLSALSGHCSVQQVFDLIAIHGMYVILAGMINSFGLTLDKAVQERLPATTSKTDFDKEFPRN